MERNTKEIIEALSVNPVQQYILDHEHDDVNDLLLKNKQILGIPARFITEQIVSRRKAREKLPLYYQTQGIIFPPPLNFEQASSESTARFKEALLKSLLSDKSATGADLTGGYGVDTFFLSRVTHRMHYSEPEKTLLDIARHNHNVLGVKNIEYHSLKAEDFIHTTIPQLDFIYLDPSRRTGARKKIQALEDSQPGVLKLSSEIFKKTNLLLIKASPLLDIQAGIKQLAFVKKVFVLSVANECKELLFLGEKNFEGTPSVEAVNLLNDLVSQKFEFSFPEERRAEVLFSDPLKYLYEPNASILKAGAFKSVAVRYNLKKIHPSTHLYTASQWVEEFPGRKFLIENFVRPDRAEIKKYLPEGKANVTTRNYPLSPEALKNKTGLKDGGEKFLIGFSGQHKKFLVVAKRL